jgi:hypothetical protein
LDVAIADASLLQARFEKRCRREDFAIVGHHPLDTNAPAGSFSGSETLSFTLLA